MRTLFKAVVGAVGLAVYVLVIVDVILVAACWEVLSSGSADGGGDREVSVRQSLAQRA